MPEYKTVVQDKVSGFLQKQLWLVRATLVGDKSSLTDHLPAHYEFILDLEQRGIVFAAGPILTDEGDNSGNGVLVLRAESKQQVESLLQQDPFYSHGLRRYDIELWQVNVGQCQLRVNFSNQTGRLI